MLIVLSSCVHSSSILFDDAVWTDTNVDHLIKCWQQKLQCCGVLFVEYEESCILIRLQYVFDIKKTNEKEEEEEEMVRTGPLRWTFSHLFYLIFSLFLTSLISFLFALFSSLNKSCIYIVSGENIKWRKNLCIMAIGAARAQRWRDDERNT